MGIKFERNAGEEIATESKSNLIPVGKYNATIVDAEVGEFASGPGKGNGGRPMLKLQFRDADETIGKSRMFVNLGLFANWAPTAKNPKGSDNFGLFNFLAALLIEDGESMSQADKRVRKEFIENEDFSIPDPEELLGTPLVVKVTQNKEKTSNNYSFLPAGSEGVSGPKEEATVKVEEFEEL